MPISSIQTVKDTSAEVKALVCGGLKPKPAPASLLAAMGTLPEGEKNESADVYRARLTLDQRAILDAFNKEATDAGMWKGVCAS